MSDDLAVGARPAVALVCAEPRLGRILRLALEVRGYEVRESADLDRLPATVALDAAVLDVDSLGVAPREAARRLRAGGARAGLPLLIISIYPREPESLPQRHPTTYLQPPFAPEELVRRLERLLNRTDRATVLGVDGSPIPQAG